MNGYLNKDIILEENDNFIFYRNDTEIEEFYKYLFNLGLMNILFSLNKMKYSDDDFVSSIWWVLKSKDTLNVFVVMKIIYGLLIKNEKPIYYFYKTDNKKLQKIYNKFLIKYYDFVIEEKNNYLYRRKDEIH